MNKKNMSREKLLRMIGEVVPEKTLREYWNNWNPIVTVDRSACSKYKAQVKEVKHPEFERVGPAEFDVRKLKQYLHNKQRCGYTTTGEEIYNDLVAKNMLEGCINLSDLLAIQVRGADFCQNYLHGSICPAWPSIVSLSNDVVHVPCLLMCGAVSLIWVPIHSNFRPSEAALRHAS